MSCKGSPPPHLFMLLLQIVCVKPAACDVTKGTNPSPRSDNVHRPTPTPTPTFRRPPVSAASFLPQKLAQAPPKAFTFRRKQRAKYAASTPSRQLVMVKIFTTVLMKGHIIADLPEMKTVCATQSEFPTLFKFIQAHKTLFGKQFYLCCPPPTPPPLHPLDSACRH